MSETGPQPSAIPDESEGGSAKVPLTARLMLGDSLTARRAAGIIALFTAAVTILGGVLECLLDHEEYPTLGRGLWFALQTVTTVGYGDVTPSRASGRFIATVLMLSAVGFLAVITAGVTATLVEGSRRRFTAGAESDAARRLDEIGARLERIERQLDQRTAKAPRDGLS